jgi:hypothetical protein
MTDKHTAELSDGRKVDIVVTNLGWREPGAYATEFDVCGVKHVSWFACTYHEPMLCPEPDVRLALDVEYREDVLQLQFGAQMVELSA